MKKYWQEHKKNILWLLIGLLAILVTSFAQFLIQTSGCSVKVTDLRNETNTGTISLSYTKTNTDGTTSTENGDFAINGEVTSGLLFVPKDASKDNKKPGIVLTHGYLNNRELQLPNAIELARRGFVVLTVDREGHGNYNNVDNANAMMATKGLYESAKYLYNLDFVDQSKIGISGHSMGGYTTAMALLTDMSPQKLKLGGTTVTASGYGIIKAGLMQGWSSFMGAGPNVSVGLLKATDDEFFFKGKDSNGNATISREFLHSTSAASFVGMSVTAGQEINVTNCARYVNGSIVEKKDGEAVGSPFRAIYEADEIHPLNHWSIPSTSHVLDFFYGAFGTPTGNSYVAEGNQIWWLKEAFSFVGMLALLSLIFPFAALMLTIPFFTSLKTKRKSTVNADGSVKLEYVPVTSESIENEKKPLDKWYKHLFYWIPGIACTLFSGFIIHKVCTEWADRWFPNTQLYPQDTTNWVAMWAATCGIFAILVTLLAYAVKYCINQYRKSKSLELIDCDNPFETAKASSLSNALKTILLACIVVFALYLVVFINWNIWTVDFRLWTIVIKVFNVPEMLPTILRYSLFFGVYYILSGICNQTYRVKNLPDWATIAINSFFNIFGLFLVIMIQYGTFKSTGVLWQSDMALGYIVLFPTVVFLVFATIISRLLYKKTGNIWLGSLVNTLLFTIITVSNTAASFAYVLG